MLSKKKKIWGWKALYVISQGNVGAPFRVMLGSVRRIFHEGDLLRGSFITLIAKTFQGASIKERQISITFLIGNEIIDHRTD